MGVQTWLKTLDNAGNGTLFVPPMFYVGQDGCSSVQSEGADYGTANLTPSTAKFVEGQVDLVGPANTEVKVFLYDGG